MATARVYNKSQLFSFFAGSFWLIRFFKTVVGFVGASDSIPKCKVLSVIVVKLQMVDGMVGRAVDEGLKKFRHAEIAVVDGNGPNIDENIKTQIHKFVQREEEDVNVVPAKKILQFIHFIFRYILRTECSAEIRPPDERRGLQKVSEPSTRDAVYGTSIQFQ